MPGGSQNSPKSRRDSLSSPRVERDDSRERDSPRRNRDALRSRTITSTQDKDTKDSRGGRSEADSGKNEEPGKEGCDSDSNKGRVLPEKNINKGKEECAKGDKGAGKDREETVKGGRELLKGKDTVKSDKDADKSKEDTDLVKGGKSEKDVKRKDSPTKSLKDEKEAGRSDRDIIKSEKGAIKSGKNEKDTLKSKEELVRSGRSERDAVKKEEPARSKEDTSKSGRTEKDASTSEKENKNTTNSPTPSNTGPSAGDQSLSGMFLPTQETETGGAGMGVFLGLSSSTSTAIPFLEDTPSTTSECEIPGLSILASSDNPPPKAPPKKDQSHRSWFAIGSRNRNQGNGRTETPSNGGAGEIKEEEEKKVDEIKVEEEPIETPMEVEETKTEDSEEQKRKEAEEREARNRAVVEERLKSFIHLKENVYIGERKRSKRNKEVRRMVCDCFLTKEEMERGEVGCGDDCLNRLLMIECGSRCPLGDHCINKRFQNHQYGDVEVFNAEEKGCGLRARSDMTPGTFIMEYVGEVFDTREFKRRRKEYARDMHGHFYFMALKSDQLIDATNMGNISRFINHSCDPNAETQKWTVNGELRIGFFSKTFIEAGEEINFDYRLERYGREPQRCYCGAANCRGWLGEAPDEQTKEEKDEARRKEERDRRKREERRAFFEDIDLEEEIEKLNSHKLRNRQDTLNLSRLMVRAEDFTSRVMLLELLQTGEPACRRLFLDYHGLKVLWSWMADLGLSHQHTTLKLEILNTLEVLPITNKTQLTDSRVLSLVERWSNQGEYTPSSTTSSSLSPPPPPPPKADEASLPPPTSNLASEPDPNKKSSDTSEESDSETDPKLPIEASSADDSSLDSEVDNPKAGVEEESSDSNDAKDATAATSTIESSEDKLRVERLSDEEKEMQELLELHKTMVALAKKLLDAWKSLKEFFRIPKKERIEMMKEHEREVDRGYKEYLDQASESDRDFERDRDRRDKDRDRYNRRDHHYDRRRRSPERDKERYSRGRGGSREDRLSDSPKMSKEQRRQLFELKVQQQEEEAKQRKMQEEMWTMHVDRCRLLGHDPYLTPIFDPTYQYFWDPVAANWQPYTGSVFVPADPNLPVPAGYGLTKGEGEGSPLTLVVPGAQGCRSHLPGAGDPNDPLNPANIPLPGEVPAMPSSTPNHGHEGTPPHGPQLLSIPLPGEATTGLDGVTTVEGAETPGAITVHLPPRWRLARDASGYVYFYHVKTRVSQWEPPALLNSGLGSDSSSDSSSDSDSDSSSSTDSEDFSTEEEEEEEEVETVERTDVSDEKMIRRPKGTKRRRSEALVQERVISPIMEIDKEAARRERREAKERAREEARQERQEERSTRGQKEESTQPQTQQQQQQQQQLQQQQSETVEEVAAALGISLPTEKEKERERDRERERERRAERHEARVKREKSKERAATAIADNSDTARKIKDTFRSKMATFIVSVLNPYRRSDCREGKITCTEDFKYLARKLTHFVMVKELKQLHSIDALECSDSVKHKTRDFVRKYMSKYGSVFKRDPNDTKEY